MEPLESSILDSLERTGICIVHPDTYKVIYLNSMMRRSFPGSEVGKTCYECFGLEQPCPQCPLAQQEGPHHAPQNLQKGLLNGTLYDITHAKIQWQDGEMVFIISFNPHSFTAEERARQEAEQRLGKVLRSICDIVTQVNLKTGEYSQSDFSSRGFHLPKGVGDYRTALPRFVKRRIHPEDQKLFYNALCFEQMKRESTNPACLEGTSCRYRLMPNGGDTLWRESRAVYLKEGKTPSAFILTKDITAQMQVASLSKRNDQLEQELMDDQRYRIILQQTQTMVAEYQYKSRQRYISPLISECLSGRYDDRELLAIWMQDGVIFEEDQQKLLEFYEMVKNRQDVCVKTVLRLRSRKGGFRWYKLIASKILEESLEETRIIITINDVHAETESSLSLKYRAEYDTLTGAYNRETFYHKAYGLLHTAEEGPCFIVRLDVDRFKVVNDLFGMQKGDLLLCFIAESIRRQIKENETFGRISNDIFCMCLCREKEEVLSFISTLMDLLEAYPLSFKITPSFGIYEVENRDTPVDIMCDWANLALKTVKGSYISRYAFYDDNMRLNLLREQQIITEMHGAMESGQFQMYLQPKYNIGSSSVIGSEALVRWKHPENGLIPPGNFIPLFEKNGLILELDRYIWECACRTLRRWLDEGKTPLPISVNVSRMHLYNPYLCDNLMGLIETYGLTPRLLELELTESAYTENPKLLYETMHTLQQKGFVFLMDDFGSGYSSLNMLKDIPVDILKIDMNFLRDSQHSEQGRIILESTILMAQRLRLQVIAEGVETQEQAMFLFNAGCNKAQGYYYSKPIPVSEYEKLVYHTNENGAVPL